MEQGLQNYKRQNNLAAWSEEVQACRSSGLSVEQWCSENGIRLNTYYRHQRAVFQAMAVQTEFYEIPLKMERGKADVSIEVNGLCVEIHNGADENTILSVLRAVKTC